METILSVKGLQKRYGDFCLKGIDLEVPAGSIVGFIGDNGAGKTTTIKAILNLIRRDAGDITIFGEDNIKAERRIKQRTGVVFDACCFHESLRADDVGRILRPLYEEWDDGIYSGLLKRFALPRDKIIKDYSSGMRTKLSLAAALSHNAQLLLLDEATSGLDPVVRSEVLDLLMDFIQQEDRGVLLSSHITSDLEKICDYICYLHDGAIQFFEEKDALLERLGMLRCGQSQLGNYPEAKVLRWRQSTFGCEALVQNREALHHRHPEAVVDRVTLEDIMLLYAKGEPQ